MKSPYTQQVEPDHSTYLLLLGIIVCGFASINVCVIEGCTVK